jgi:lambda family phage portal protein
MMRDAPYAKRAKVIVVNNVVGAGIGLQAQVKFINGKLNQTINDDIETAWSEWTINNRCHTGGILHFADIERLAMGQIFETGEIFIRKHYQRFADSPIPFALEIIEPERVIDEFQPSTSIPDATVRLGIESDAFRRPIAYWIRKLHPGEIRYSAGETDRIERVPADQIYHLKVTDRWPQTRGEPWLHAVIRKLNDVDGYSEAEIIAARAASCYMATIETEHEYGDIVPEQPQNPNTREIALEPGIVERLNPGEKLNLIDPKRPNANIDPFMRMMLREIAAGTGVSYESLSRDYSQSNYSSSRLALLDDRDLWRVLQLWFIRNFRMPLHRDWLQQAILARAITSISIENYALDIPKYSAVRFKPRGWTWVDPEKEIAGAKEGIKSGFTTTTEVVALTGGGRDIEDILDERRNELDLMREKGLMFDTDPQSPEFIKKPMTGPGQPRDSKEGTKRKLIAYPGNIAMGGE